MYRTCSRRIIRKFTCSHVSEYVFVWVDRAMALAASVDLHIYLGKQNKKNESLLQKAKNSIWALLIAYTSLALSISAVDLTLFVCLFVRFLINYSFAVYEIRFKWICLHSFLAFIVLIALADGIFTDRGKK